MKSINVLIIEDDTVFYRLLNSLVISSTISNVNVSIILRANSILQTKMLKQLGYCPDLIILDLNIIDSIGIATFKRISAEFNQSAIIIVSSIEEQNIIHELKRKGAKRYITKDELNSDMLKSAMAECLHQ